MGSKQIGCFTDSLSLSVLFIPGLANPKASCDLTLGFTSNVPVTVNIRDRPKGVHTAKNRKEKKGVRNASGLNINI